MCSMQVSELILQVTYEEYGTLSYTSIVYLPLLLLTTGTIPSLVGFESDTSLVCT